MTLRRKPARARKLPKAKPVERTRGGVALLRTGKSQDEIAKLIDTSRGNVSSYLAGRWKPGDEMRAKIAEVFGIPTPWWDEGHELVEVKGTNGTVGVVAPAIVPFEMPTGANAQTAALDESIQQQMRLLLDPNVKPTPSPFERAKVSEKLAVALKNLAMIRGSDPRRVLKDSLWLRIRDALRRALAKHPAALEDVESELVKIEAD